VAGPGRRAAVATPRVVLVLAAAGARAAARVAARAAAGPVVSALGTEAEGSSGLDLDPAKPWIVSAWGKKGSGKSYLNRRLYRSFVGDKLALDVNGNAAPGPDAERLTLPLPAKWPAHAPALGEPRRPRNLWFHANPSAATYRLDLDRALAIALFPQEHRVLLWAGEVGELTPHSTSSPHMKLLLMQNRHYNVSGLFDAPRPMNVDPLVLAQSDLVAVFRLPNPADRERIAKSCGIPPREFDTECREVWGRGPRWFLLWHEESETLYRCAPLPDDVSDVPAGGAA
jgi:hypothetical protein